MDTLDGDLRGPQLALQRADLPGGEVLITVRGEIDLVTGERFKQLIIEAVGQPETRRVVLEVSGLTFLDSNGVTVLVNAHRYAQEQHVTLGIRGENELIRELLQMLGVYDMLALDGRQELRP